MKSFSLKFATTIFFLCLGFLMLSLISKGDHVFGSDFWMDDPIDSGRKGGVFPVLLSTLLLWIGAMLLSMLMGLTSAIGIFEISIHRKNLAKISLVFIFLMTGIPSVVFGLMGNHIFVVKWGLGYSILSGILTLSLMMIPLVCLSVFMGMKDLDIRVYQSANSLGLSKWRIYTKILLPHITKSILAGAILASGRILAETAALLFTSGYSDRLPSGLMDSGRSLTVHIYDLLANVTGGEQRAYESAIALLIMIYILNELIEFGFKVIRKA